MAAAAASACSPTENVVEAGDFGFDGTCVRCHDGLSAGQVHPTFKLRCVDCHGGNDQVDSVPEDAFEREADYRNEALVKESHVRPKPGLARFFYANGIDDDEDGTIDEAPEFDAGGNIVDFGEIAEFGLGGQGMGEFLDNEYNRDLNYVRWLNPGDLRVATIGCGSGSRAASDGEAGGACHQQVIDTVRRSVMVNQAAVINGAYYGNESWRATFFNARDDRGPAFDPRAGAFGYQLDYGNIDACINSDDVEGDAPGGRAQPTFNSACLEGRAVMSDPNAASGAPGNVGLPAFEATHGALVGAAPGTIPGQTIRHTGAKAGRIAWGGNPLIDPNASLPELQPVPAEEVLPGIPDPVDLVLRGFRAYYPLNYIGSGSNFPFTFGESILPGIANNVTNNPFGRGHSSGCTACHGQYAHDGRRNGTDPTTKHREFDPATQDIVDAGGKTILAGIAVNRADRIRAVLGDVVNPSAQEQEDALAQRPQQRFYTSDHTLNSRITTDQCGLCHAFVTRIDFAYQGIAEDEQRDLLARKKTIDFTTPNGTAVVIHDSWIREEALGGNPADRTVVIPSGVGIADLARARDQDLRDNAGLIPGWGGCAPNVFTEDCNNNGELDTLVVLEQRTEDGGVIARAEINEDLNGNGVLDLISHTPRENSVDGRQLRYVYGGANGSTRMMDIHFERGMHCIDCHMLQDTHGDGNIYSTNWDTIEIECEDCHGGLANATLVTSGANGLNDLRGAKDHDNRPFFEKSGSKVIQRSRVTPGLFWEVPQVPDSFDDPKAAAAHADYHLPEPAPPGQHNRGSTFAGVQGESELESAKLECYACHTSWIHNCQGCHFNVNLGDNVKKRVNVNLTVDAVPGENETWFNNVNQPARTNFQLLEFMRSPFLLGVNASADKGRIGTFRSSMQVHVSITDGNGDTLLENMTFTTHQAVDANSGRTNVATSGAAMNQTMPHTVRTFETRDCDQCHRLVDEQGRTRNDHILGETWGVGSGRYPYIGDWVLVAGETGAGGSGLRAFDIKQENQLAGSAGLSRFPGIITNPNGPTAAGVEPVFNGGGLAAGSVATDVALIRNFAPLPAQAGGTQAPTLKDFAVMSAQNGVDGRVVVSDITLRGHPGGAQPNTGTADAITIDTPGSAEALAHLAPDISDPFIYVADGSAGLTTIELTGAAGPEGNVTSTVAIPGGADATEITLAGDVAYVGTDQGTVEVFDLADPRTPVHRGSFNGGGGTIRGLTVGAMHLFIASSAGVAILEVANQFSPDVVPGAGGELVVPGIDARELYYSDGHLYVAAAAAGVLDIDVTVPAAPVNNGNIIPTIQPGENANAVDVVVNRVPGQTWLLIAENNGNLVGLKLDNTQSTRERCLPNNTCGLDMDWRDPTIMGRDPSFDPVNGVFFGGDPSGPPFFRIANANLTTGERIARPALWEKIGTQSGRRYRDSFMPGSGVLSRQVMERMYSVPVCEIPGTVDETGNGLGDIGIFDGSACQPVSDEVLGIGLTTRASKASAAADSPMCEASADEGAQCLPGQN